MKSFKTDVAVLMLFFTRTSLTKHSFAQICKARPSKLFLYQDGPRKGREDDVKKIQECRNMVESMIDWECEVHRLYQEKNYGCDPSGHMSQKWMFSFVDRGIIIEDDVVMSESFFPFCKELLDKYADDTRINMICGQNHLGVYDAGGADYFFSNRGSIWGWATWKRNIDSRDLDYKFLDNDYTMKCLEVVRGKKNWKRFIKTCTWHKSTEKAHFESLRTSNQYVNSQLNIVPTKNMTCNIGIGAESTHSVPKITLLNRGLRKVFFQETYELNFPLKDPEYVVDDLRYVKKITKVMNGGFFSQFFKIRRVERILYRVFPLLGKLGCNKLLERIAKYS